MKVLQKDHGKMELKDMFVAKNFEIPAQFPHNTHFL